MSLLCQYFLLFITSLFRYEENNENETGNNNGKENRYKMLERMDCKLRHIFPQYNTK